MNMIDNDNDDETKKCFLDAAYFGVSFAKDNKHIPLEDIYMSNFNMIDHVAKALYEWEIKNKTIVNLPFDNLDGHFKQAARIAIESMREPTKEMLDAGECKYFDTSNHEVGESWKAMIEEALKE